jgi:ATP-dependent DNA helicase RecG
VPDASATPKTEGEPASPPDVLAPLHAPLTSLRGVGESVANLLARVTGGTRVLDLLFHLPESFVDRRHRPTIKAAVPGQVATLEVEVVRHEAPANPRQPWRVVVTDGTAFAELVFFKPARAQSLAAGARVLVSGKLDRFGDRLTMPHPDFLAPADHPERIPALEPVWPLTAGPCSPPCPSGTNRR